MTDSTVTLSDSLDFTRVPSLHATLKAEFDKGQAFTVDATAVSRTDSMGLQLLMLAAHWHQRSFDEPLAVRASDALASALSDVAATSMGSLHVSSD